MSFARLLLVLTYLAIAPLYADIAPTVFAGGTVVPIDVTDLRLQNAKVVITWGKPCDLVADFEIVSDRTTPFTHEIGFPVGGFDPVYRYDQDLKSRTDGIQSNQEAVGADVIDIQLNGTHIQAFRRLGLPEQVRTGSGHASWYFAEVTLNPGINRIHLHTKLEPSGVYYSPYERVIEYCIWTGGKWGGQIGHERVEIVFPTKIEGDLIQELSPWFMKAEEDRIVWECTNITPTDGFYDIKLKVLIPEVNQLLLEMKRAADSSPDDAKAVLRYTRHLFALGFEKGNYGYCPSHLLTTNYYQLLSKLTGPGRAALVDLYSDFRSEKVLKRENSDGRQDSILLDSLVDLGYCANYSGVHFALRARAILEEFLLKHRDCEEGWRLFLQYYWKTSMGALGHPYGPVKMGKRQLDYLNQAQEACPKSKLLQDWPQTIKELQDRKWGKQGHPSLVEDIPNEFKAIYNNYKIDW